MNIDGPGHYLPCSYGEMIEQQERYLRRKKGASDHFIYDCTKCQFADDCPYPEMKGKGV
jgi:hypothetical protein